MTRSGPIALTTGALRGRLVAFGGSVRSRNPSRRDRSVRLELTGRLALSCTPPAERQLLDDLAPVLARSPLYWR